MCGHTCYNIRSMILKKSHMTSLFSRSVDQSQELFHLKKVKLLSVSCGVSLGKQIGLHTEFLSQLDKWHQLFERGATSVFFKELQAPILEEMKTL